MTGRPTIEQVARLFAEQCASVDERVRELWEASARNVMDGANRARLLDVLWSQEPPNGAGWWLRSAAQPTAAPQLINVPVGADVTVFDAEDGSWWFGPLTLPDAA